MGTATGTGAQALPLTPLPFTKMHALGNDYVYLNAVSDPGIADRTDLPELARTLSHRRTGIGADGLIIIQIPELNSQISPGTAVRMRIFNADGSEAEMCGNGIRCVAKYAVEHRLVPDAPPGSLTIQSAAGLHPITYTTDPATGNVHAVSVDMGAPSFNLPVNHAHLTTVPDRPATYTFTADDYSVTATLVSVGNPHAVVCLDSGEALTSLDLASLGPAIENHPAFHPHRINAQFVHVINANEVKIRTWERGSGITHACGTGACAVCVAAVLLNKTARTITTHLPGGRLSINWSPENDHLYMTGPATELFTGTWPG